MATGNREMRLIAARKKEPRPGAFVIPNAASVGAFGMRSPAGATIATMFTPKIPERRSDRSKWQFGLKAMLIVTALFEVATWLRVPQRLVARWHVVTGGPEVSPYDEQVDPRAAFLLVYAVALLTVGLACAIGNSHAAPASVCIIVTAA
jgi:hypothetical protein